MVVFITFGFILAAGVDRLFWFARVVSIEFLIFVSWFFSSLNLEATSGLISLYSVCINLNAPDPLTNARQMVL